MDAFLYKLTSTSAILAFLALGTIACDGDGTSETSQKNVTTITIDRSKGSALTQTAAAASEVATAASPAPREIKPFVAKALGWLVEAQQKDGGWGGGSHAHQDVRDPAQVPTDPATTAFAAMALLRGGHTPVQGDYRDAVRKATEYLVSTVESASESGPLITDKSGTQPQSKLGPLVDTSMTAQYLARVLPKLPREHALHGRVDKALDKCLTKLQTSQKQDGSWNFAGWAPVLQSSAGCTALELAQAAGKKINQKALDKAREYQKGNFDVASGSAKKEAAAGVELYSFAGAQRGNAAESRVAEDIVAQAKRDGKLKASDSVSVENLKKAGASQTQAQAYFSAVTQNTAQIKRLTGDEKLLLGFGNNGGEEYLSYLMTSEALVIAGGDAWGKWNDKMHARLEKIQDANGSWSGHHCITSPVFCTAAVAQCLLTDRDAQTLVQIAKAAAAQK